MVDQSSSGSHPKRQITGTRLDFQALLEKVRISPFLWYPCLLNGLDSVLAIYAKSAGKAGKHCQVSDSSNITAVSNLPIQLFDHFIGVQF
ncbi:hypothetical protein L208DRAFT_1257743 [Tricholoma matsutake]|nr:hypothetical protein L208DRAFT_1257743 [Tricholoma matsutake 945]